MGPAHSTVVNKTQKKLCVITFDQADLIYSFYRNMYIIEPGESKVVEALTNPQGLKIGIVYDAVPDSQLLLYQRWNVKNESSLTVTYMNAGDISTFGDDTSCKGKFEVKCRDENSFATAVEALTYVSPVSRPR